MVSTQAIPHETRAYVKLLRNHMHMSFRQISKECNISISSAHRIFNGKRQHNARHHRPMGRPRKIKPAMVRRILRQVKRLRLSEGSFTVPRLMQACGLWGAQLSRRTVLNVLHRNGYRFRQARKKGLLKAADLNIRLQYARKMAKRPASFWCDDVSFYLDAVSFAHKNNPLDQAKAPRSRVYRKKSEGLKLGCTSKGKKEGTGGNYAKFIVGITHGKGVVLCQRYEKMTGRFFADFINEHFPNAFTTADKDTDLFVQDGDPSQNSAIARAAMQNVNAQLLKIPARSPDINPIENFFHIVSRRLREDAIHHQYTHESLPDFELRIIRTMKAIPQNIVDNTIASIRNRLIQIVQTRGQRVKY